jgi:hypothetical protein
MLADDVAFSLASGDQFELDSSSTEYTTRRTRAVCHRYSSYH